MSIVARGLGALRQLLATWGLGRTSAPAPPTQEADARTQPQGEAASVASVEAQQASARVLLSAAGAEAALHVDQGGTATLLGLTDAEAAELLEDALAASARLMLSTGVVAAELQVDQAGEAVLLALADAEAAALLVDQPAAGRLLEQQTGEAALAA